MPKRQINPNTWIEDIRNQLSGYHPWLVESGIACVVGLVMGFVCRNFGRYLFFFCVSALITLCILEYANMISIQAPGLRALFKRPDDTVFTWLNTVVTLIRAHPLATLALLIGFLFGWRLGQ